MEYFDFDQASFDPQYIEDDVASTGIDLDDDVDRISNNDSFFLEKECDLQEESLSLDESRKGILPRSNLINGYKDYNDYKDLMFRAASPCDFCSRMGLDCFMIQRGVLQKGCTCCISLYRECSFTHQKVPGKFLETLHPVGEDTDIPTGGLTGKRVLKSLGGPSNAESAESRSRKSGSRLSREAVRVLKKWLADHIDHPYPTGQEKDDLQGVTGLRHSQICNWLANARRRGKARSIPPWNNSPGSGLPSIPIQPIPPNVDLSLMTPLERWKHSPPENEPASAKDIMRAMVDNSLESSPYLSAQQHSAARSASRKTSSNESSFQSMLQEPSVSSLDTENRSSISDFSFASVFSHHSSLGSFGSTDKKERRRRRKPSAPTSNVTRSKSRGLRIFQCTFCPESFLTKYDWQRHEKSLHLTLDSWQCSPDDGIMVIYGKRFCSFCNAPDPDSEHLELQHNFMSCREKMVQDRTFYRKDHLNQHLRLMHDATFQPWMESWKRATTNVTSRCGFCSSTFTTWKDRVDHLAAHFKNGANVKDWKGDWGFEPHIQCLVENASRPSSIAIHPESMNPYESFSSVQVGPEDMFENPPIPGIDLHGAPDSFDHISMKLKTFIQRRMKDGIVPTDEDLQSHARMILYGNDDPSNRTEVDNPTYLEQLKRDCGLLSPNDLIFDGLDMQFPEAITRFMPPSQSASSYNSGFLPASHRQSPGFHSPGYSSSDNQGSAVRFQSRVPSIFSSVANSSTSSFAISPGGSGLDTTCSPTLMCSGLVPALINPFMEMNFDVDDLDKFIDTSAVMDGGI